MTSFVCSLPVQWVKKWSHWLCRGICTVNLLATSEKTKYAFPGYWGQPECTAAQGHLQSSLILEAQQPRRHSAGSQCKPVQIFRASDFSTHNALQITLLYFGIFLHVVRHRTGTAGLIASKTDFLTCVGKLNKFKQQLKYTCFQKYAQID